MRFNIPTDNPACSRSMWLVRVGHPTPGPGSTAGYLFTWEDGSGTLPNATGGDFDLLRIQGEGGTEAHQMEGDVPGQNSGMHLTNGNAYRFVYIAKGFNFEARVYHLPD